MKKTKEPVAPPVTGPTTDRMLTGRVANGRSIEIPSGERAFRCFNPVGEALYVPVMRKVGPGAEVTLPESEFTRLRQLGFIEDPSKIVRTEAQAVQLLGAKVVELNKDAADGEHARADGRGASARIR